MHVEIQIDAAQPHGDDIDKIIADDRNESSRWSNKRLAANSVADRYIFSRL
jgi:hypothetical protein